MYKKFKKVIYTLFGATVAGASLELFLVPLNIAPGGVSGIATIIHGVSGIGVGVLILLINIPILILGFLNFDKKFLLYSFLGTLALSLSGQAFENIGALTDNPLLAAVFGGAGMGFGLGTVLSVNSTTGGADIFVLLLKKKFPAISVGQLFLLIDGIIILVAGVVFKRWEVVLYSALALFVTGKVLDAVISGVDYAKMVYVISEKAEKISLEIYGSMNRGVTGFNSVSMYTGKARYVLLCVIRKTELPKLKQLVHKVDNEAFMIVSDAREVLGKGFKTHIS